MKCISIVPDEIDYIKVNASEWLCEPCLSNVFPFNHIEDQDEFDDTLFNLFRSGSSLCFLSDKIFSPIDVNADFNEFDMLNDLDPDINFYNSVQQSIGKCKYYFEDMFNDEIRKNTASNFLSMIHINIRSAKKNLGNFEAYLHLLDLKFKIIALTESWLQDSNWDLYNLPGYDVFDSHRSYKKGGGVAIYIDSMYISKRRTDLDIFNDYCESIFIEIDRELVNMSRNVVIGVIYRVPNTDIASFIKSISYVLDIVKKEKKVCYLLGDYNLDLLKSDSHAMTGKYLDLLSSHSFLPMINRPTRVTANTATIIDNIFTNYVSNVNNCMQGIFVTDVSDHYPIFHINFDYFSKDIDRFIIKRKYTSTNKQAFLEDLREIDWQNATDHTTTNDSFNGFHSILKELHNKHFPKSKIKIRYNNNKPWLSDDLRESIKIKNKLYCLSKRIPSVYNEENYRKYKNRLQHRMRTEEKKYNGELFEKYRGNMKKSWNLIKSIIHRGKKTKVQNKFTCNGNIINDKNIICEKFNNFFTGIGPSLADAIPHQNRQPESYLNERLVNNIFLTMVTEKEIVEIVNDLNNGAPGYDDIPASILKLALPCIAAPLVYICNLSLWEGMFPDALKIANVVPLFKNGDAMLFNNYRPVSLLCVISKVFEKVMYSRLNDFLTAHQILYLYQFGFRKDHSSYMALMVLIDKLTKCLENGDYVVGVYLDFSKAFDTVNHEILLKKLDHYVIRSAALSWFEIYLSNRTQFVTYDSVSSNCKSISCGVPQGSILGPLLFLLYINDLNSVCKDAMSIFFADDSNLFKNGKDILKLEEDLNDILSNISEWLKVNKLSLNVKKTHYMIFTRKRSAKIEKPKVNLKIDGQSLSEVVKTKFLGMIIDNKLAWKDHVNFICGKIARGIGIMLKSRHYLYRNTLTTLYYSFVYPYYVYCNHIWGNSTSANLKRLYTLQKKAIRIIYHVKPKRHTETKPKKKLSSEQIFKKLKLLNVWQMNKYLIGQFMYKCYHGKLPFVFENVFTRNRSVHLYDTRQAPMYFIVPKVRTNYRKASIHFRGPSIWNDIIKDKISPDVSISRFKRQLKDSLINGNL